jgi:arginine repressor
VLLDRKIMTNQTLYICGLQQLYEFSLHNHAFIYHNNKRRVVPSHSSKSSNFYLDILLLTTDDEHDFILILTAPGSKLVLTTYVDMT